MLHCANARQVSYCIHCRCFVALNLALGEISYKLLGGTRRVSKQRIIVQDRLLLN